ncbi:MAG: hypothetical protein H6538_08155 [Bacteroidales bacterium]|nr:hypothetical protein [Bacteroidales bacterium]MCB9000133.1 hypothetical protein [Bacteroidales bacterium]MCB9013490.1 hypothetical protein [Bacteroidales bacterium]
MSVTLKGTLLIFGLLFWSFQTYSQAETDNDIGVTVKVPVKEKKSNSYIALTGGYMTPAWYRVPMTAEFPGSMLLKNSMEAKAEGWFAGIRIMKKSKSHFAAGITASYYYSTIPVGFAGMRSGSDWVMEQSGGVSFYTDPLPNDINRVSEVIVIRALVKYNIPFGKFQFWVGLAPGTFSSNIHFTEANQSQDLGSFRATSLGITTQTGLDYLIKNDEGKEKMRFSIFADFGTPRVEEKFISLIKPGWRFINSEGNYVINPLRIGLAIGFN